MAFFFFFFATELTSISLQRHEKRLSNLKHLRLRPQQGTLRDGDLLSKSEPEHQKCFKEGAMRLRRAEALNTLVGWGRKNNDMFFPVKRKGRRETKGTSWLSGSKQGCEQRAYQPLWQLLMSTVLSGVKWELSPLLLKRKLPSGVFPMFHLLFHSVGVCTHGTQLLQSRLSALPAPWDVDTFITNNSQKAPKCKVWAPWFQIPSHLDPSTHLWGT